MLTTYNFASLHQKDKDRIGKCFIRSNLGNIHLNTSSVQNTMTLAQVISSLQDKFMYIHMQNVQMSNGNNSGNI